MPDWKFRQPEAVENSKLPTRARDTVKLRGGRQRCLVFSPLPRKRGRVGRGRLGRSANAGSCRERRRRFSEGLVHDSPDSASATPTFSAASQTPIDLTGRSDSALGRNRSDLMVRNHVARTHDHDGTPGSIRCFMSMRSALERILRITTLSLPFRDDVPQVQ